MWDVGCGDAGEWRIEGVAAGLPAAITGNIC